MKKEEIKEEINKKSELELIDFYNSVACRIGSVDDFIHINNQTFFKNEFLNNADAEQSKRINKYNAKDKYIRMLEYMQIETSNDLKTFIDIDFFIELCFEHRKELIEIGILTSKIIVK